MKPSNAARRSDESHGLAHAHLFCSTLGASDWIDVTIDNLEEFRGRAQLQTMLTRVERILVVESSFDDATAEEASIELSHGIVASRQAALELAELNEK